MQRTDGIGMTTSDVAWNEPSTAASTAITTPLSVRSRTTNVGMHVLGMAEYDLARQRFAAKDYRGALAHVETLLARTDLPAGAHRQVLWNAPMRMYRLDEREMAGAVSSGA